jgi:hypothetical protein
VDDAGLLALLGDLSGDAPKPGLTDPDEVPETPEEPYVTPGELWALGDHRLLCGDATSPADVERLLDGATPTFGGNGPALRRPARSDLARRRVQRAAQAGAAKPYMMREASAGSPTTARYPKLLSDRRPSVLR